jgi:predicted DNA-binding protein (UPF0251 family)
LPEQFIYELARSDDTEHVSGSYVAAVHVMDALMGASAEGAHRPTLHTQRFVGAQRVTSPEGWGLLDSSPFGSKALMPALVDTSSADVSIAAFVNQVRNATERLPFDQAHALWLVDVCGCTYDQVAHETNTSRTTIAGRVDNGRQSVRAMLVTESTVTSVG